MGYLRSFQYKVFARVLLFIGFAIHVDCYIQGGLDNGMCSDLSGFVKCPVVIPTVFYSSLPTYPDVAERRC